MTARPRILILGTLDTKGEEFAFLRDELRDRHCDTIVMDLGILGDPLFEGDITRDEVLSRSGLSALELSNGNNREEAINAAILGGGEIAQELLSAGEINGVICMGGGSGTAIGTAIMTALPLGFPKVLVTTLSNVNPIAQSSDIVIVRTMVDLVGLNSITKIYIQHAAGAIAGMAKIPTRIEDFRKSVVITCLGVTTPGVMALRRILMASGKDVIVLHRRTAAVEKLLAAGLVESMVDFTPSEITEAAIFPGRQEVDSRLLPIRNSGIPLVTCAGGLDMIIQLVPADKRPPELADRPYVVHSPTATLIRTTVPEQRLLGEILGRQLSSSHGPAAAVIPMEGFSMWDQHGKLFDQPAARRTFADALKASSKDVPVYEVNAHINDEMFSKVVAEVLLSISALGRNNE